MMTMKELFDALTQERELFLDAIKNVADTTLDKKGIVGEWSIKNVLAHLADWEQVVTDFLPERLKTGRTPETLLTINADEDGWNARQVAVREHFSPQEQLANLKQTRFVLLQVLENLGEEAINSTHPWPQWEGTLGEYVIQALNDHDREHRELVLAALKQI